MYGPVKNRNADTLCVFFPSRGTGEASELVYGMRLMGKTGNWEDGEEVYVIHEHRKAIHNWCIPFEN